MVQFQRSALVKGLIGVLGLTVAGNMSGCAAKDAPLSTDQLSTLKAITSGLKESTASATSAAETNDSNLAKRRALRAAYRLALGKKFAVEDETETEETTEETNDELDAALANAAELCTFEYEVSGMDESGEMDLSSGTTDMTFSLAVKDAEGQTCPMVFSMSLTMAGQDMDMEFEFEIQDDDLKDAAEVSKAEYKFEFKSSEDEVSLEGEGKMTTKEQGEIKIKFEGEGSAEEYSLTQEIELEDFTSVLKETHDKDGTTYTLNGEEITEEEYNEVLIPLDGGMGGGSDTTEPSEDDMDLGADPGAPPAVN